MLTSIVEGSEYSYQIAPYHGYVHVHIVCRNRNYQDNSTRLWLTIMDKKFGRAFASNPRPKDYKKAKVWANEQINLIRQNGTATIVKPEFLKN